jgi:hypothetical protein
VIVPAIGSKVNAQSRVRLDRAANATRVASGEIARSSSAVVPEVSRFPGGTFEKGLDIL